MKKKETKDDKKVSDFVDLTNEVTGTVKPASLRALEATIDVTLPPGPNPDDEMTGTEDAIPSAMPV